MKKNNILIHNKRNKTI